jgi:hypothetical protein
MTETTKSPRTRRDGSESFSEIISLGDDGRHAGSTRRSTLPAGARAGSIAIESSLMRYGEAASAAFRGSTQV